MTIHRDVATNRARTGQIVRERLSGVNWLGHEVTSGAAQIDEMLLEGATWEQLLRARRNEGAVRQHLRHLVEEHGLRTVEVNGTIMFDRGDLGMPGS